MNSVQNYLMEFTVYPSNEDLKTAENYAKSKAIECLKIIDEDAKLEIDENYHIVLKSNVLDLESRLNIQSEFDICFSDKLNQLGYKD